MVKSVNHKSPTDYHQLAQQRGFVWLGPEVSTTRQKTSWSCSREHSWQAAYATIRQGNGCPECAALNRKRLSPTDYQALAAQRGYRWVGPEVSNGKMKTQWECEQGHQWWARYENIKAGRSCPVCTKHQPKVPDDYHALAQARGFIWIGPEVRTTAMKTTWQCSLGHQWQAAYENILQGTGCPICAHRIPKTPDDYKLLAVQRGFTWIGPGVPKVTLSTTWECEQGHQWQACYNSIQQGTGCPYCQKVAPKTAVDYHLLAESKGLQWVGELPANSESKTEWACSQGHHWWATYRSVIQNSCPVCGGSLPKTPDDYRNLAESRHFEWLGSEVINTKTKTRWRCQDGHEWDATYSKIRSGRGCPECARLARRYRNFQQFG